MKCLGGTLLALLGLVIAAPADAARSRASRPAPGRTTARTPAQSQAVVANVLERVTDQIWEHGDYYFHNGRYTDRIATDRLVIAMDPPFLEAYSTAAWLLENTGKDAEALKLYQRATQVGPNEWKPWHELGHFYFTRKRYPEAIRTYEQAVKRKGAPPFVWHPLAHSYERTGQLRKALETWEKVRYIDAADPAIDANVPRIEEKLKAQGAASGERS